MQLPWFAILSWLTARSNMKSLEEELEEIAARGSGPRLDFVLPPEEVAKPPELEEKAAIDPTEEFSSPAPLAAARTAGKRPP